ncbi:MAG: redoxin domain-containing protein [Saprospiraceae bacterium]|nr:redoxin domain-containing protein [Saprospiraceae bacterium]
MAVTIGQQAPDFKLYASDKKEVTLSEFNGRNVIVLFFPLAFTGTCTAELCSIRDDIGSYNNMDAQVLGISVDSLFTLDKFKAEQNLNFPLLSDFNKEVSASYGALYDTFVLGMKGVSKRSAFVVDKKGVIQYAEVLESAGDIPNFVAIKEVLSKLA